MGLLVPHREDVEDPLKKEVERAWSSSVKDSTEFCRESCLVRSEIREAIEGATHSVGKRNRGKQHHHSASVQR